MAMYIGGGAAASDSFGGAPTPLIPGGGFPFRGRNALPSGSPTSAPPNVLGAQSVRPTGPSSGFDPQYLQNLATAIGGLFSRPNGSLSFNPLGNLSDISSPSLGFGTAPLPGLPSTMLQDAINGLAFMFNQPTTISGASNPVIGGGVGGDNGGRDRRRGPNP